MIGIIIMLIGLICFSALFICLTEIQEYSRFADRDMTMRYHWGLGIGHKYSHDRDNGTQYPLSWLYVCKYMSIFRQPCSNESYSQIHVQEIRP